MRPFPKAGAVMKKKEKTISRQKLYITIIKELSGSLAEPVPTLFLYNYNI